MDATTAPARAQIPEALRWRLEDIYPDRETWQRDLAALERQIEDLAARKGTLARGAAALAAALQAQDRMEALAEKLWWYPALRHDQDLRDNEVEADKQRVALLLARANSETAWMRPEILALGHETVRSWLDRSEELSLYRFLLEDLFRQQEHVLDTEGETLLSYAGPLGGTPAQAYAMLSTADARWPEVELSGGRRVRVSYSEYQRLLNTERDPRDRRRVFEALYGTFAATRNTYAALYAAVCHRDWFHARARAYPSSLEATLDTDAIDRTVVDNLVETTRRGVAPLRRYFELRKSTLGLDEIHLYDATLPLLDEQRRYAWEETVEHVLASVQPLGDEYVARMREAFAGRWIDVLENEGKRSGAYSAGVYGVHPYVLLNYKETRNDLFTVAHEMGHSLHTVYAHTSQPHVYARYTIFVAEVASTLNEALLLEHLLQKSDDPRERAMLLQHAIDSIVGTFYTQVLFADFERQAHQRIERGDPITADLLDEIYGQLLVDFYGSAITHDPLYRGTWARIPHFYRTPFYVYQYATCFASAAVLRRRILDGDDREAAVRSYLDLLRSGGSAYPMDQLRSAGVDLDRPEPIEAVVAQLDELVTRLERELAVL